MTYGWEGNRRCGVALAMRQRLKWFIHLRARWPSNGDQHDAYTHRKGLMSASPFYFDHLQLYTWRCVDKMADWAAVVPFVGDTAAATGLRHGVFLHSVHKM